MKKIISISALLIFGISVFVFNFNNEESMNDNVVFAIKIDGVTATNFPTTGNYKVDSDCSGGVGKWLAAEKKFIVEDITGTIKCSINFTTITNNDYLTEYVNNVGTSGDGSIINENGYRYTGKNPNNYVWFNNEMWRIIGSFDTAETGTSNGNYNVKIIRDDVLDGYAWSSSNTNIWYGTNDSTASSLYKILNTNYYNATDGTNSGYCYVYSTSALGDCNFEQKGIQNAYRNMVMNAKWRTGGYSSSSVTASAMYEYEGTTSYDESTRPLISPGYIGLMSASDYGYASSSCYSSTNLGSMSSSTCTGSNWLYGKGYEWTISQYSSYAYIAFNVDSSGYVNYSIADYGYSPRPVLYLKSNVYVVSGDGSEVNPYILGM